MSIRRLLIAALPDGARMTTARWRLAQRGFAIALLAVCLNLMGGAAAPGQSAIPQTDLTIPHHTRAEVGSDLTEPGFGFRYDNACVVSDTGEQPMTSAELAHPFTRGIRLSDSESAHSCVRRGWIIPTPATVVPTQPGQVILVSIRQQWLWAFQDGQMVYANPVATGAPDLRTPTGSFTILRKTANTTFYSPWPRSSPHYYTPEHINYALLFRQGGFYIHDAPWRSLFGPGANSEHLTPGGSPETGSHGCVNVSTSTGKWLYQWAAVGALVLIVDSAPSA